jgi:DNA-binding GntR family transcriptional regulator
VPELARRLNVSRSPIREAGLQLVSEGLAVEQPRRSVVVAMIELNDVLDIHEIREFVEALSARLCADRIDAEGIPEPRSPRQFFGCGLVDHLASAQIEAMTLSGVSPS